MSGNMKTLGGIKWAAAREIDEAAGEVRLRYITEVPGQQAVYLIKLQEAQAFLPAHAADADAPVPPYLAAVAAATGQTPAAIAQEVLDLGTLWNTQLGPAIEAARLAGKAGVMAAQTAEDVATAKLNALVALQAI